MCVSTIFHCKKTVELLESIIIPLNKMPEGKRNRKQITIYLQPSYLS